MVDLCTVVVALTGGQIVDFLAAHLLLVGTAYRVFGPGINEISCFTVIVSCKAYYENHTYKISFII